MGYASLDHLADLIGTNRPHLIQWKNGAEPQLRHRERLAELSQGRYTPDDFRTRPAAGERAGGGLTLAGLAAAHAKLEETVRLLKETVDRLDRQGQTPARKDSRRARGAGGQ